MILVGIVVLVSLVPIISTLIVQADDQRACTTDTHPYECIDLDDGQINWCSNETAAGLHCVPPRPIYNATANLCTNASGVHVTNSTQITSCDSTYWAAGIVPYTDSGLNTSETTMLYMVVLFLVLGLVFMVVKETGLLKRK